MEYRITTPLIVYLMHVWMIEVGIYTVYILFLAFELNNVTVSNKRKFKLLVSILRDTSVAFLNALYKNEVVIKVQ